MTVPHAMTNGLEAIEDAILAALQADSAIAAYARSITPWQGTVDAAVSQVTLRDPAILVSFVGFEGERMGGHDLLHCQWTVLVRDRNLRGQAARRTPGSSSETGTYAMVQDVLRVLTGNDFGLAGMEPLQPRACELLKTSTDSSKSTSAYVIVFSADTDLLAIAPDQALATFDHTVGLVNPDEAGGPDTTLDIDGPTVTLEP